MWNAVPSAKPKQAQNIALKAWQYIGQKDDKNGKSKYYDYSFSGPSTAPERSNDTQCNQQECTDQEVLRFVSKKYQIANNGRANTYFEQYDRQYAA